MPAGDFYVANDPELNAAKRHARQLLCRFTGSEAENFADRRSILEELFVSFGNDSVVHPSLRGDDGFNLFVGRKVFFNFDCILLDRNRIDIGDDVQFGPGVQIYTATHPLDAASRKSGQELAKQSRRSNHDPQQLAQALDQRRVQLAARESLINSPPQARGMHA
jgi:maltose O-acetyltransferase